MAGILRLVRTDRSEKSIAHEKSPNFSEKRIRNTNWQTALLSTQTPVNNPNSRNTDLYCHQMALPSVFVFISCQLHTTFAQIGHCFQVSIIKTGTCQNFRIIWSQWPYCVSISARLFVLLSLGIFFIVTLLLSILKERCSNPGKEKNFPTSLRKRTTLTVLETFKILSLVEDISYICSSSPRECHIIRRVDTLALGVIANCSKQHWLSAKISRPPTTRNSQTKLYFWPENRN